MSSKVLFVDDDANALGAIYRNFRRQYEMDVALGGEQALVAMAEHGPYAVVVADMAMPGMNGIEFLHQAQELAPDTVRIMLTGHLGQATLMEAINRGQVFRFLAKPCESEEIVRGLDAGIRQHQLLAGERDLLETTLSRCLQAMTGILATLDPAAAASADLLAERAALVARAMKAPGAWTIALTARLSPLWILRVPQALRMRMGEPELPAPDEAEAFGSALAAAADLVAPIPRLEEVAEILRWQGAYGDGTGAPGPLGARILRALVDFNAIEERCRSGAVALESLRMNAVRYDPEVLAAIAKALDLPLHAH